MAGAPPHAGPRRRARPAAHVGPPAPGGAVPARPANPPRAPAPSAHAPHARRRLHFAQPAPGINAARQPGHVRARPRRVSRMRARAGGRIGGVRRGVAPRAGAHCSARRALIGARAAATFQKERWAARGRDRRALARGGGAVAGERAASEKGARCGWTWVRRGAGWLRIAGPIWTRVLKMHRGRPIFGSIEAREADDRRREGYRFLFTSRRRVDSVD